MATIRVHEVKVTYTPLSAVEEKISAVTGGFFGGKNSLAAQGSYMRPGAQSEPPRQWALDGVSLEIRHGETMGILGPSGCGKSTLLRAIAGLIPLTSGHITYDDVDQAEVPVGERGIGIVFQNYALYPNMTSQGNVGFFFRLRHREAEIPERIREVSQVMGIGFNKLLGRHPAQLSGGERQRVAVARCIARDPKLFLFDEPLSNLDAKLRTQTRLELKRLIMRYKTTGVYVTHDQTEALSLCDRIAIINDGRIEQIGTAQFIFEHPISTFVATFFGHPPMNLFEGVMVERRWLGNDDLSFELPGPELGDGRRVTLGIRAEHMRLDPQGPLRGRVVLVEPMPVQRAVLAYIESPRHRLAVQIPVEDSPHIGEELRLTMNAEHCHLFDTRTGRRL